MEEYTVHKLAKITNISVRALHHYDDLGLLKPSRIGNNGYRFYNQDRLVRLMRIMLYRELDFSLAEISDLMHTKQENQFIALEKQKTLLKLKNKKIKDKIKTIDLIIASLQSDENIDTKKLSNAFRTDDIEKYKTEAKTRWGHTDAYRQSVERSKKWTQSDVEKIKKEGESITRAIANLSDRAISDPEVQAYIAKHHTHINRFYDCSINMYRGLGELYFNDPRFAEFYEKIKPGLALFMKEAIEYYCMHAK